MERFREQTAMQDDGILSCPSRSPAFSPAAASMRALEKPIVGFSGTGESLLELHHCFKLDL
jgi:hypothetical protein